MGWDGRLGVDRSWPYRYSTGPIAGLSFRIRARRGCRINQTMLGMLVAPSEPDRRHVTEMGRDRVVRVTSEHVNF